MTNDENPRETLGSTLRKARERRGLSLDQVSSATKIHVKIISDLEADRYEELPAEPFTRGFIYNYARFLGLPPNGLFEEFKGFLDEKWKKNRSRSRGVTGYAFERPEGEQSRRMLWAIMIGMFVLGMLVIVIFKPALKHKKHGHIDKLRAGMTPTPAPSELPSLVASASPVAVPVVTPTSAARETPASSGAAVVAATPSASPLPVNSATPAPVPSAATPAPTPSVIAVTPQPTNRTDQLQNGSDYDPAEVKHKLVFKAFADVTVQYRCDDKSLMKFTLRKDRILVLRGKESIRLQVSNPRAIGLSQGAKGYVALSETKRTFLFGGTSTLVQPADLRSKFGEKWEGATPLPETPDPAPAAGTGADAPAPAAPEPALSPTS